eukprot:365661-Chlamydomonas_euryale.AAC.54
MMGQKGRLLCGHPSKRPAFAGNVETLCVARAGHLGAGSTRASVQGGNVHRPTLCRGKSAL